MQTIFWLSVLAQIIGFGVFVLSVIGAHMPSTSSVEQLYKSMYGPIYLYRWSYLTIGIVGLIISLTI